MINEELRLGIEAAKNNDLEKAKSLLARAVKNNPNSEEGWLWLGNCLTDTEQRKFCYERVLRLNPQNENAQQALNNMFLAQVVTAAPDGFGDDSQKVNEIPKSTRRKSNSRTFRVLGLMAGWAICGLPLLFLIYSGVFDVVKKELPQNTETEVITPPSNDNSITSDDQSPPIFSEVDIYQVRELISNENYADAILMLDEIIKSSPELDEPYFLRAYCYYFLMQRQRSQFEFQDYLNRALTDIDKAIAIRRDNGDYYALRQSILVNLSAFQDYRVDRQHVIEYALENALMAVRLGTTIEPYPDRIYIDDLISSGRCEEALKELSQAIDSTNPDDISIGGLYHMQSRAYICLGNVDQALLMVDRSMFNNTNMELKYESKSIYLYQAGRIAESLDLLNTLLDQEPNYDAWRYFLRALIYLEMGERDKAENDLILGSGNAWSQVGLYQYVKGKMALEDGNIEEGIALLQQAEATLEYIFNPLQKRILAELQQLSAEPLKITPSVMLDATAIPTIQARPTARPLQTPAMMDTPIVTATPTPGISIPNNIQDVIVVDMETGTGEITFLPNDYPLFRFQPAESIPIKEVISLVIHLVPLSEQKEDPDVQIYFWVPRGGGWRHIDAMWGDNPVERAYDHVLPEGDIFIAMRNWGDKTIVFKNITLTLVVETTDGSIKTYGLGLP